MQPSSAEADAEAIRLIASRIQAAAAVYESSLPKLYPEGEFSGDTVTGSHRATVAGIRHTDSSAAVGIRIADQISAIAGILSQAQGNVADLDATLGDAGTDNSIERAFHRALIAKTMTDSYSNPVIGANGSLPEYDTAPLPQLGAGFEPDLVDALGGAGSRSGSGDTSPALLAGTGTTNASGPDGSSGPGGPGGEQAAYMAGQAQDTPFTMGSGSDASGASEGGPTPGPLNGAFGAPVAGGAGVGRPTSAAALNTARGGASGGSSGSGLGSAGSGAGRAGGGGVVGGAGSEPGPLGRRMPASLVTPATGANQSAGATPSAGTRGGNPMGSPAGGRGAGKDKDGEHRAPSYLHTRENGEEMVGRLPLVGPPVLGDWARVLDLGPTGENSTPAVPGDKGPDDKQQ